MSDVMEIRHCLYSRMRLACHCAWRARSDQLANVAEWSEETAAALAEAQEQLQVPTARN